MPIAVSSYVDDFCGGPLRTESKRNDKKNAQLLLDNLISIGDYTNTRMNLDKCLSPARIMDMLGIIFNSLNRTCYLPAKKITKYIDRLQLIQKIKRSFTKDLEKIIGNLVFASWVIPCGRSFISHISFFLDRKNPKKVIILDSIALTACEL